MFNRLQKKINFIINNGTLMKLIKNSSWLIGDKVFTMIIGVFVTAVVARYFGPEKYGQFNYALSFVTLFTAISTLGLENLAVKALIDNEYDEGTILYTSMMMRLIGGGILTIFSTIIIRLVEPGKFDLHLLVLIMSITMIFKALEVIEYWIQAHQLGRLSSIIRMGAYIIMAILKLILIGLNGSLYGYALIYTFNALLIGVGLVIAYIKVANKTLRFKFDKDFAKNIMSNSWYLILTGLLGTLYMQIDKIMLGNILIGNKEVGIYSAANQISQMWYFIPSAIIISFKPLILRYKTIDNNKYIKMIQSLYATVAWVGIGFGIIIFLSSDFIISILYGSDYISASKILSISVWAGTFATLGSARGVWLIAENLQKYSLIYIGSGAIVNIYLNYLLIPDFGGYGAAIATLVSQVVVAIITPMFIKETRISAIMILKAFLLKGFR